MWINAMQTRADGKKRSLCSLFLLEFSACWVAFDIVASILLQKCPVHRAIPELATPCMDDIDKVKNLYINSYAFLSTTCHYRHCVVRIWMGFFVTIFCQVKITHKHRSFTFYRQLFGNVCVCCAVQLVVAQTQRRHHRDPSSFYRLLTMRRTGVEWILCVYVCRAADDVTCAN